MGNLIVDDVLRVLSEADIEPKCPKCGSRKVFVSYSREFTADLGTDTSEEAVGTSLDPLNITCNECGHLIYEE